MMKEESEMQKLHKQLISIHDELKIYGIQHVFILIDNDQPYVFGKIKLEHLATILIDILRSNNELQKLVNINL